MFHKVLAAKGPKPDLSQGYRVQEVRDLEGLQKLAPEWRALEARDRESGLFLSFAWMSDVLAREPGRWHVLVVRGARDGTCRCIFPVWPMRRRNLDTGTVHTALRPAGRLAWAEYTGFLCDPVWQVPSLSVLAKHLARRDWNSIDLIYMADAERAGIFAEGFDPRVFQVEAHANLIHDGTTDTHICPRVDLPRDFDAYLTSLSKNKRQRLRRFLRDHIDTGELRLTVSTDDSFDADLDLLLELWRRRWAGIKSPAALTRMMASHRQNMRGCHKIRAGHIAMLWQGDRPLAAIGLIADRRRDEVLVKLTGRDPDVEDLSTGVMSHLLAIRWAISQGFTVYDFGHGNEAYKYGFGAYDRSLLYLSVKRR